jgi:hypothetical protein
VTKTHHPICDVAPLSVLDALHQNFEDLARIQRLLPYFFSSIQFQHPGPAASLLVPAGGESSWLCHFCRGLNQQRLGGRFCPRRGGECKHANVRHVMIIFVCLLALFVQLVLILVCACPKYE